MRIQLLCDNPNSWMVPYAMQLVEEFGKAHDTTLVYTASSVVEGDILVLLSCENIFRDLHLNKCNLVAHASDLPKGKGWSPLTWQILEGKNNIPVTLFEAASKVDSGRIYGKTLIQLDGSELIEETRKKLFDSIRELLIKFINEYPTIAGEDQSGEESFYPKRKPEDSELDMDKSLSDQFNLLRIGDNERYPVYFKRNGVKYILKIYKVDERHSD